MNESANQPGTGVYPIRAVCEATGVHPVTLRAWERRYGLILPMRTGKGHRLYSDADVARIRRVLALLEEGVPVSRVRPLLDAAGPRAHPADPAPTGAPFQDYEQRLLAALRVFDEPALDAVYNDALSLYPVSLVAAKLSTPILRRLGEAWRDDEAGIAREHFFSTFLRNRIGARLGQANRTATGPRLLAACPSGEHHELGLMQFALAAATAGYRVVMVGSDLPPGQIGAAAGAAACRAVVLSVSSNSRGATLARLLAEVVAAAGMPVLAGGAGVQRHRPVVEEAGAIPLGADFSDALATLARVVRRR